MATVNVRKVVGASVGVGVVLVLLALLVAVPIWVWYWWRIEPGNGELAVLIRKTGDPLSAGDILATSPGQKGIQAEVLPEGRYFRNPYTWDWKIYPMTDIPAGQLGVLVRNFGKDLPPGRIIAEKDSRGIESEILRPGKYRINPYAYQVVLQEAIHVRPGYVGVQTHLIGSDNLDGTVPAGDLNTFLVSDASKGVSDQVLDPGTYYLNPFIWSVVEVNLQSQRFEMGGDEIIVFLTADGFTVRVEGTIEYSLQRDQAALLTHKVGDMDDIVKKLILPRARGFIRIEGSKKTAVDFIVGETRQAFQNDLEAHLKATCEPFGVSIHSVLIRNIIPPNDIATIIRDRELAAQDARKYTQQIDQANSKAELVKQEMLAQQNSAKVTAETAMMRAAISAKQNLSVKVTNAQRELQVATIDKSTAEAKAGALITAAEAERDIIRLGNEADAGVLATKAQAFGGGMGWARYNLQTRLAPRLQGIMTTDENVGQLLPLQLAPAASTSPRPPDRAAATSQEVTR